MNLIDLDTAITEIRQACARSEATHRSPFFFVVGAGISHPSIPIASNLVTQFKEIARKYGKKDEPKFSKGVDEYAYWFQAAYPQRSDRQVFLRSLMEKKAITHANLRLAHLLLARTVTNLVVTPNFDDFLTKSLQLFGKYHLICDHPMTVERIDHEQDDVQIVHVHGTYSFYDCCNLKGEIQSQAETSQDSYTMGFLLDQILYRRSPLVLGYSGWEGDVIMTALKKRLDQGRLPRRIYWFCYRRIDVDQLPQWVRERGLRAEDDVCFVVRNKEESPEEEPGRATPSPRHDYLGDAIPDQGTLEAEDVFAAMIKAFELTQPLLTSDPLGFFVEHLRALLPNISAQNEDIYFIPNVIRRIERAKALDTEATNRAQVSEAALEEVRAAVRRADYGEAITKAISILKNPAVSTGMNANELMDAVWLATRGLSDNAKEKLEGYNLIILSCKALMRHETSVNLRARLATVLVEKGLVLGQLNQNEEALAAYDDVIDTFGECTEPVLVGEVGRALVNKANRLADLSQHEEALSVYDEVLTRFGDSQEPVLREAVARALNNKGATLIALDRQDDAVASFNDIVNRLGDAQDSGLAEQVAQALLRKGHYLFELNRYEEAIAAYDDVIKLFGESQELALRNELGYALNKKAATLLKMNRHEEAIRLADEVVQRFGDAIESTLQERVATALLGKGMILDFHKRDEEALIAYNEVAKRFSRAPDPSLRSSVVSALISKANKLKALNRQEEASATYRSVVNDFGDATEPALREQVEEARAALQSMPAESN